MSNALELKNITKTFPGVKALDNMQLSLEKGEIHAICGENGAGKSTLMKIITGVYQPDKGDIILNGEKVTFKNPNEAYDKGISIIYQENSLFPDLTVLENMFIGHEPTKSIGPIKAIDYKAMT
ncbi:ATP-binding cassette domain-containing protein [Schnuerera ultunensis]|uniref:Guanosine ABC transporter (ATP-binding protein) n=3 Tax=Schnuerera ultunensis TaxID=45497 RepID=A0A1M4PLH6_9FIRM